jgi:hypothetical protein
VKLLTPSSIKEKRHKINIKKKRAELLERDFMGRKKNPTTVSSFVTIVMRAMNGGSTCEVYAAVF